MDYRQEKAVIIKKEALNKTCFRFVLSCKNIADMAQAGQFAHILVEGFSLRRPISICEVDKQNGTISLVFEIRGEGTEALSKLSENETMDIMAPLGKGFTLLESDKTAIVVGGGIGVPPMVEVAKNYGKSCTAIIGFRNSDAVILKDDFLKLNAKTVLCTDDGSEGEKGYVSNALERELADKKPDIIYACGPHMMLKAIIELADKHGILCEVSLEERMGCGVGACLVCACKTVKNGKEYFAHVCKDGPVFNSKEVVL